MSNGYLPLKAFMDEYAALIEPTAKENGLLWPADNAQQVVNLTKKCVNCPKFKKKR